LTTAQSDGTQVESITLTFDLAQAREVAQVLPWVLHALEDRPGLTAKQRRRRQVTTSALSGLLEQLTERLRAFPPTEAQETRA
jgi:hypothetical protein